MHTSDYHRPIHSSSHKENVNHVINIFFHLITDKRVSMYNVFNTTCLTQPWLWLNLPRFLFYYIEIKIRHLKHTTTRWNGAFNSKIPKSMPIRIRCVMMMIIIKGQVSISQIYSINKRYKYFSVIYLSYLTTLNCH